jgi:hypothetical protein
MCDRQTGLTIATTRKSLRTAVLQPTFRCRFWAVVGLCLALMVNCLLIVSVPALARTTDGTALAGATAELFKAVAVNDMSGVKQALAAGADINAKNTAGKTAADLAVDRGHFIIAHFLLSQRSPEREAKPQPSTSKSRSPRRLTPRPAAPAKTATKRRKTTPRKTITQPLKEKRRFSKPPMKPALDGTMGLTPPAVKARKSVAKSKTRRFAMPPRKPPAPLPEAIIIAEAPGLTPGDAEQPPVDVLPTDMPGGDNLAELPAATEDSDALPEELNEQPEQALSDQKSAELGSVEQGPVGKFFQNLLDLVKPDTAAPVAKPKTIAKAARPKTPSADSDSELAADLDRELDIANNESTPSAAADKVSKTKIRQNPAQDTSDIVELKDIDDLIDEKDDNTKIRRVAPPKPAIRRAVPAPKIKPQRLAQPAQSSTERTLDRLSGLVGSKPKEDEFGLPEVEITGSPESEDTLDILPEIVDGQVAMKDDDEPSIESLLNDGPETPPGDTLDELPSIEPPTKTRAPNVDDEPGPEQPERSVEADDPAATRPAQAPKNFPRSAPTQPVQLADTPTSSRQRPRFMSTADRLRRLNEALSREVPLDAPMRQARLTISDKVTDFMITGLPPEKSSRRSKAPPSSLPTRPLSARSGPSDRFVDRLERIRRNAYDDEPTTSPQPTAPAQIATATPIPTQTPVAIPKPAAQSIPEKEEEDSSPLSQLVKFFKRADNRQDTSKKDSGVAAQSDYRAKPSLGTPKAAMAEPAPLAKAAVAANADPKPGQTAGKMTPGFMGNLSRLFTDEKVAEKGWAAEVEILEPEAKLADDTSPKLEPVASAPVAETATPADTEPALPPPTPTPLGNAHAYIIGRG